MFEKFGEFDSVEEINRVAAARLAQGNVEEVLMIAEENGIDKEDAQDFIDGVVPELATLLMAAQGKLELEVKYLKAEGILEGWSGSVIQCCLEDETLCRAVRKKGKSLKGCLGQILKHAFRIKKKVHDDIVKAAGLTPPVYLGIPGRAELEKLIKEYYMGPEK